MAQSEIHSPEIAKIIEDMSKNIFAKKELPKLEDNLVVGPVSAGDVQTGITPNRGSVSSLKYSPSQISAPSHVITTNQLSQVSGHSRLLSFLAERERAIDACVTFLSWTIKNREQPIKHLVWDCPCGVQVSCDRIVCGCGTEANGAYKIHIIL